MQYEKKQITKEDGRYLVYYHFANTASKEQSAAFEAVEALDRSVRTDESYLSDSSDLSDQSNPRDHPIV